MGQGAYIFGCEGTRLTPDEKAFFADANPFGFILFTRNIQNPEQVRALTNDMRECVGWQVPIFIDQEGGRVDRLNPEYWQRTLPALDQVDRSGPHAERSMWLRSRLIADDLSAVGIDANCAPLGDIVTDDTHPVLKNRCYGRDPDTVTTIANATAQAMLDAGVLPVVKHIPGYGRATKDAHHSLSVVPAPKSELTATDFAPFRSLAHLPMAMTAHLVYSSLDDQPATQSEIIVDIIRSEIGFQGLLMGDDISMEALDGDLCTRTTASLGAGCDIVLHCNGDLDEMTKIADTAGKMNPKSQSRADSALAWRQTPNPFDRQLALAELGALLGRDVHV